MFYACFNGGELVILEIMQRDYLSKSAEVVESILAEQIGGSGEILDPKLRSMMQEQQLEPEELMVAIARTREAVRFLSAPAEEAAAIFPRDPAASLLQTVLQRYFLEHGLVQHAPAAGAGELVQPISDVSLDPSVAVPVPKRLFGAMQQTDVRWIACLAAKVYRKFAKRRPFPDEPAVPVRIKDNSRLFLVADWGSGIKRAKKIGDRIKVMLGETDREQHVIHLGDVYYSGWPEEYEDHFLANWPVMPGQEKQYGSWCLNGNHDMFSGGHGYFDYLLKDARFERQRSAKNTPASYFSLENHSWLILGLDTAWDDGDVAGSQMEWVEQRQKASPNKGLILLSHHQPFSAFEQEYIKLQPLLSRNRVTAWFWGHEHRFAMYKPRPDVQYARLIGHGGVPVWARAWSNLSDVEYVSNRRFFSGLEEFALFGFAILDLAGDKIRIRYLDEHGSEEKAETIEPCVKP
jgi:hypothetical protein